MLQPYSPSSRLLIFQKNRESNHLRLYINNFGVRIGEEVFRDFSLGSEAWKLKNYVSSFVDGCYSLH